MDYTTRNLLCFSGSSLSDNSERNGKNGQPRGTTVRKHLVLDKSPNRHTDNNSTHTEEKHTISTSEEGTPKYVARSTFRPHEDQNLSLQLKTGPSTQEPGQRPQAKHSLKEHGWQMVHDDEQAGMAKRSCSHVPHRWGHSQRTAT